MSRLIDAFKNLAVAMGCADTAAEVTGETVDEVINFIAENLPEQPAPDPEETSE